MLLFGLISETLKKVQKCAQFISLKGSKKRVSEVKKKKKKKKKKTGDGGGDLGEEGKGKSL